MQNASQMQPKDRHCLPQSFKILNWAVAMIQGLRVLTAFAKDLNLFPSTHIRQLTTAYCSSSKGSDTVFWTLWALYTHAAQTLRHIYTHIK